jgi:hypothetical protein
MATNVNETAENTQITSQDEFLKTLKRVNSLKAQGKEVLGKVSETLTRAETSHNLDKKAFSVIAGCTRMETSRLNSFLRNLDAYRDYAGLDQLAGEDMFAEVPPRRGRPPKKAEGNGAEKPRKVIHRNRPTKRKQKKPPASSYAETAREPGMALAADSDTAGRG